METSGTGFVKSASEFVSRGVRCRGDLYLPKGSQKPPIVIMAHGFGGERTFRLPAYAERFVERGMAVYLFDYRCFGDSDGEPRNYVDPRRHLQDWQSAIAHVRALSQINSDRIALWGTSFSGGHVVVTAAGDQKITAIVSQVPFADSISSLRELGIQYVLQATLHGLRDLVSAVFRRPPHTVKIVGLPYEFACMNTSDALEGMMSLLPADATWKNKCPARILLTVTSYRPTDSAAKVSCPALIMLADNDSLIPALAVENMAGKIPNSTLVKYPIGHFDIYTGSWFEEAVAMQAEFLAKHLGCSN